MIEDIINSNKILNYEKRGIRLILLIGIISVMSSCSVIYRSIDFVSESDHWKRDPPSYYYMYTNNTDSIGIWAWGTDMSRDVAIFFGPPLFPIIPTAIQVWEKPDRRIKIDLFLNTNQLCNINFDSVSIVDHKGKKIIKAKFLGTSSQEPIISKVIKEYGIDINILGGTIDKLSTVNIGHLYLELDGNLDTQTKAIELMQTMDVIVEVIYNGY